MVHTQKHTHSYVRYITYNTTIILFYLIMRMKKAAAVAGTNLKPGVHGAVSLRQYGDVESAIANVVGFALIASCTANCRR